MRPSIIAVLLIKIWKIILLRPGWIAVPAFLVLRRSLAFCCFRFRLRQASRSRVYPADTPVMRIIYCPRKHMRIEIFDNFKFKCLMISNVCFTKTGTKPVTLKFWIGKVNALLRGFDKCSSFYNCISIHRSRSWVIRIMHVFVYNLSYPEIEI